MSHPQTKTRTRRVVTALLKHLTQNELATRMRVSQGTISHWSCGKSGANPRSLELLEAMLSNIQTKIETAP